MSVVYYSNSQPICLESLAAFVQIWIVVGVNVTDISFSLLFQHYFYGFVTSSLDSVESYSLMQSLEAVKLKKSVTVL